MNEHATRAWERARLAERATDQATAWTYMHDAIWALNLSIIRREHETDQARATRAIRRACHMRAMAAQNATKPAPDWIDAAAVSDFNEES